MSFLLRKEALDPYRDTVQGLQEKVQKVTKVVLADELENTSNIRVNSLNPGATRTAMRAAAYPGEDPQTLKTADDLMPVYLYLLSDDSAALNGQALNAQ